MEAKKIEALIRMILRVRPDLKFANVKGYNCYIISSKEDNMTEINTKDIRFGKMPNDGYYKLIPATCNDHNDCRIGHPATDCVEKGHFDTEKCAIWYFYPVLNELFKFTLDELYNLLQENK